MKQFSAYTHPIEMQRKWFWIAIIGIISLFTLFFWKGVLTAACLNVSALALARAAIGPIAEKPQSIEKAAVWLTKVQAIIANSTSVARLTLQIWSTEGQPRSAEQVMAVAAFADKDDSLSYLCAGKILWESGYKEDAMGYWRSGENIEYYYAHVGDEYYKEKNKDAAFENYYISQAISESADYQTFQMYQNLCEYNLANSTSSALANCEKALAIRRNFWTVFALGRAHYQNGDYETALTTLLTAKSIKTDTPMLYYYLGLVYERTQDANQAIRAYEEGLALDPTNPHLNLAAGDEYCKLGKLEEAIRCYERVLLRGEVIELRDRAQIRLDGIGSCR